MTVAPKKVEKEGGGEKRRTKVGEKEGRRRLEDVGEFVGSVVALLEGRTVARACRRSHGG